MKTHPLTIPLLATLALTQADCRAIALATAPGRDAMPPDVATQEADQRFAQALLDGAYDRLPEVIEALTAQAVARPRDGRVHTLLGLAHLWVASEKDRAVHPTPRLTEHVVLSRHYLASARALVPEDDRVAGWSEGAQLATSTLLDDARGRREGYFDMKDAISAYPEFNLFSASFIFSRLPHEDPKYGPEVVETMFEAFERCYGPASDWPARRAALVRALSDRPVTEGPKRTCHPSPLAPHNIEGFFLHFGDALSKQGRLDDARAAWSLASAAPGYARWPHRGELERRLADPEAHAKVARASKNGEGMMITSRVSCSGCHEGAPIRPTTNPNGPVLR